MPQSKSPASPLDSAADTDEQRSSESAPQNETVERFVGQWNRLVSTTNWEKGRIICQWREALIADGAAVTEYSDEAWAQLVGNVTSQHVGRLRRVFQRFGELTDQYEGLYWSHFQAAHDWDDAEMWLEGAIQNQWSVSQMRGKRWETLGTPPEAQRAEVEQGEFLDESETPVPSSAGDDNTKVGTVASSTTSVKSLSSTDETSTDSSPKSAEPHESSPAKEKSNRKRLNVDVESLPDDLADAFESFKLAIIAHRHDGWSETTPETVVECLNALRELALAEGD